MFYFEIGKITTIQFISSFLKICFSWHSFGVFFIYLRPIVKIIPLTLMLYFLPPRSPHHDYLFITAITIYILYHSTYWIQVHLFSMYLLPLIDSLTSICYTFSSHTLINNIHRLLHTSIYPLHLVSQITAKCKNETGWQTVRNIVWIWRQLRGEERGKGVFFAGRASGAWSLVRGVDRQRRIYHVGCMHASPPKAWLDSLCYLMLLCNSMLYAVSKSILVQI